MAGEEETARLRETERRQVLAAAATYQAQGRFEPAVTLFERAVRMAPADPEGWSALVVCLFTARRPDLALEAAAAGLERAGPNAGLLSARAQVLQSLSRVDEAAADYQQALNLDPGRFEARFGLALQAVETGDWPAAEAFVAPLIAQHPAAPNLAWLAARIAVGRGDLETARQGLSALAAGEALAPDQRAAALLLLGEALDGLGLPGDAFAAAAEGKAIQRQLFAERAAGREGEVAKLRRLRGWFEAADPAPWQSAPAVRPSPDEAASHVFLFGFPRSGTTLLEQALAGHSDVIALEEAPTLAEAFAEFMTSAEGLERLAALSAAQAAEWRARYWAQVKAHGAAVTGRLFLDKAPAGTLTMPLVAKLFPDAKVLFALRDPRDVVLSCVRNDFQLNAMTYAFTSLEETAACYDACMALAGAYAAILPIEVMEARHEALIADFAGGLAAITAWLGLDPQPAMLDVAATVAGRTVRTPSAAQLRAGVNTAGAGRWRAYAAELEPVMAVLAPWVETFSYAGAEG